MAKHLVARRKFVLTMTLHLSRLHWSQRSQSRKIQSNQQDEWCTGDHTIILGLQIFLDHRSSKTIDQKLCWPTPTPLNKKKMRPNNDIALVTIAPGPKKPKPEHSIKSIRRIALVRYFYALIRILGLILFYSLAFYCTPFFILDLGQSIKTA